MSPDAPTIPRWADLSPDEQALGYACVVGYLVSALPASGLRRLADAVAALDIGTNDRRISDYGAALLVHKADQRVPQ